MRILSCCSRQMRPANEKLVFHNLVFVSIKKTYPMQAYKIMHVHVVVHHDDVFGEHHLAHAPEAVHDFVGERTRLACVGQRPR